MKQGRQELPHTDTGRERYQETVYKEWEKACRQRWRALLLVVKAKLEAVDVGITSFDEEFLAFTVLPDGSTAGDWMLPQIESAYDVGEMPKMLPAGEESSQQS